MKFPTFKSIAAQAPIITAVQSQGRGTRVGNSDVIWMDSDLSSMETRALAFMKGLKGERSALPEVISDDSHLEIPE